MECHVDNLSFCLNFALSFWNKSSHSALLNEIFYVNNFEMLYFYFRHKEPAILRWSVHISRLQSNNFKPRINEMLWKFFFVIFHECTKISAKLVIFTELNEQMLRFNGFWHMKAIGKQVLCHEREKRVVVQRLFKHFNQIFVSECHTFHHGWCMFQTVKQQWHHFKTLGSG